MDTLDRVLFSILGLCFLLVIGLLGFIVYIVADSVSLPIHESAGQVVGKNYHHAYTTTMVVSTGRSTTIVPQYHPERYEICAYIEGARKSACGNFPSTTWQQINRGDRIQTSYSTGRFSGGTYLKGITY